MKLCKDCKWCDYDGNFSKCKAPSNISVVNINAVTGVMEDSIWEFCETQRDHSWSMCRQLGTCGQVGRWFEPKE